MLDPSFLSRQNGVISMNPMGTIQTLPSRRKVGMVPLGSASHGFLVAPEVASGDACGRGSAGRARALATGTVAECGSIAVVLATWPRLRKVLTGVGSTGGMTEEPAA